MFKAPRPRPKRHRRDRYAAAIQDAHRVEEAVIDLTQPLRVRHAHVLEMNLHGIARATAIFFQLLAGRVATGVGLDDERGDAVLRLDVLVGAREHHTEARYRALSDEHLGAVDQPTFAVAHGAGLQRGAVRARARLGQRPGRQPFTRAGTAQVFLLLRFVTETQHVTGAEAVVAGDGERQRAVDAGALFHAHRVRQHVHAGTAVLFRMRMPSRPSSASRATISCGKRCSSSQRLAKGLTSRSQNSRTAARKI